MQSDRLRVLFKEMDHDSSGYLTIASIKKCLLRLGRDIDKEELDLMMKEHNLTLEDVIDYDMFQKIMKEDFLDRKQML